MQLKRVDLTSILLYEQKIVKSSKNRLGLMIYQRAGSYSICATGEIGIKNDDWMVILGMKIVKIFVNR